MRAARPLGGQAVFPVPFRGFNIRFSEARVFLDNIGCRIASFDEMLNGRNTNARSRYDHRLMRDVSVLFEGSNLRRLPLPQQLRFTSYIFHNATDREQRILSIDHTAHTSGFRFCKLHFALQDIERDVGPWRLAIRCQLLCHAPEVRQRTLVSVFEHAKSPKANDIFERVDARIGGLSIFSGVLRLEEPELIPVCKLPH